MTTGKHAPSSRTRVHASPTLRTTVLFAAVRLLHRHHLHHHQPAHLASTTTRPRAAASPAGRRKRLRGVALSKRPRGEGTHTGTGEDVRNGRSLLYSGV